MYYISNPNPLLFSQPLLYTSVHSRDETDDDDDDDSACRRWLGLDSIYYETNPPSTVYTYSMMMDDDAAVVCRCLSCFFVVDR